MNPSAAYEYWVKTAEEDYKVMEHLFEKGDYHYSLFFGHLVLEKTLTGQHAPFTHSLIYLSEKSNLSLEENRTTFLETVNQFNIEARYLDKKFEFYKICTKEFAANYIERIKEFYKWLLTLI